MYLTWWETVLHHWPLTIFVPVILLVIGTLAAIIRAVDGAEERRPPVEHAVRADEPRVDLDPAPAGPGDTPAADSVTSPS